MFNIASNQLSMNSQRQLSASSNRISDSIDRLSSGRRINSAKDDAAGLAISSRMEVNSRGLDVAARNITDGISALTIADAGLSESTEILQRMRELCIQGKNGTLSASDITETIMVELQECVDGVDDIFNRTTFNNQRLLSPTAPPSGSDINTWSATLQVGSSKDDQLNFKVFNATLDSFGDPTGYPNFPSFLSALATGNEIQHVILPQDLDLILGWTDTSLDAISHARSNVGANLSRLEYAISNVKSFHLQSEGSRGRIVDADFAQETAQLARNQILQNAGVAMVSQANALPKTVLGLLLNQ